MAARFLRHRGISRTTAGTAADRRFAHNGFDIWRFDRTSGRDPLEPGAQTLAEGLKALRAAGYRRILVAGHSRGGWIALGVLRQPGVADAIVALSPAAHGARPERREQAMQDWAALWQSAAPARTRIVLVQLAEDPLDPDPAARRAIAQRAAARNGMPFLSIYLPPAPMGHMGAYEPAMEVRFGRQIAAFVIPR